MIFGGGKERGTEFGLQARQLSSICVANANVIQPRASLGKAKRYKIADSRWPKITNWRKTLAISLRDLALLGHLVIDLQHASNPNVPRELASLFYAARLQLLAHALVEQHAV